MNEIMLAAVAINAVRGAVTDLRIRHERIYILQHQTIQSMVMDAATVHLQLRQVARASAIGI